MKYIDRNGKRIEDESKQDILLKAMYTTIVGRMVLKPLVSPFFSKLAGSFLSTKLSCPLIKPFIESNHIDMSQFESRKFSSYNDFFTRKIKPGQRVLEGDDHTLISPCDSYVTAFPITNNLILQVKNTEYSVRSLLRSQKLASRFAGGYALICRLTVNDYHRYCYATSGNQSKNYKIPGILHTVNPIANDYTTIYKENSREYTVIHSDFLGDVVQMEVGALMVGKISNHKQSCHVNRGEEKGYFEFGGSTIILLVQKDRVSLETNFLTNTKSGYETQVRLGDKIGQAILH